ncbi:unnamed protein product [Microthlaspi erraticum]|uniref:Mei2-like C-terminal RNA recognition motif domain-containing protein n=1 Tax=Microthlaspi erraticum TaxID=1685480 RepID=A0A6D2LPF2_9BRAS|nr:unnamed protein product [Microthlaspi erraticum]
MEETKKAALVPLNPKAPEFYPKSGAKKISPPCHGKPKFRYPPPPRPVFFRCYKSYKKPSKALNAKLEKPRQPYRFMFCNRKCPPPPRCLPPRLLKQKGWVPKNRSFPPANTVPPPPPPEEVQTEPLFGDKTSLMIRNIPNNFERSELLRILDIHCWKENKDADFRQILSSYDFLYLPMDFVKHANLGYAFVNFTSSVAAEKFRREFDNCVWTNSGYNKICEITVAKCQGKEELSQRFKNSTFPCHTDEYLPVALSPPSDGFTGYCLTTLGHRWERRR